MEKLESEGDAELSILVEHGFDLKFAQDEFLKLTSLIDALFVESNPIPLKFALSLLQFVAQLLSPRHLLGLKLLHLSVDVFCPMLDFPLQDFFEGFFALIRPEVPTGDGGALALKRRQRGK